MCREIQGGGKTPTLDDLEKLAVEKIDESKIMVSVISLFIHEIERMNVQMEECVRSCKENSLNDILFQKYFETCMHRSSVIKSNSTKIIESMEVMLMRETKYQSALEQFYRSIKT